MSMWFLYFGLGILFAVVCFALIAVVYAAGVNDGKKRAGKPEEAPDVVLYDDTGVS